MTGVPAHPEALAVSDLGRVHLIGIGGAGMSVIASLLRARGLQVQGSDTRPGAVLDSLRANGIEIWVGHRAEQIAGADTLVISSAVREDNPELEMGRLAGVRILHRSQALAALMVDSRSVAVAGAHGKTTTSAMLAVTLRAAGLDPSFAIGGSVLTPSGPLGGGHLGAGSVLVAEADESDGSFLNYAPWIAVVTNVEPDHLDHYGSPEAFEAAFSAFASLIRPGGALIACADDAGARRLAAARRATGGRTVTYGVAHDADVRIHGYSAAPGAGGIAQLTIDPSVRPLAQGADPSRGGGVVESETLRLEIAVPGLFNALNAAAAISAAILLGVPPAGAVLGAGTFMGTGRRFESIGVAGGVRVVDDYAHHPTEVVALLAGARPVAGSGRLVVLFQPHLFSRTRLFAGEFAEALDAADVVVVTGIYAAREDPQEGVTGQLITEQMGLVDSTYVEDRLEAARFVARTARSGDLVLTVGAGDVTELGRVILAELEGGLP